MYIPPSGLVEYEDGKMRCFWCGEHEDYVHYHDIEWGKRVTNDHALFEKIVLEGFQSGLSWLTILRKREAFRKEFSNFDFNKIAKYNVKDINRMLRNEEIVRHRGKIEAAIHNARKAQDLVKEFGSLKSFLKQFTPPPSTRRKRVTWARLKKINTTSESERLSKELKRRGWRYVGPTTMYAFMQSVGMVNDHIEGCHFR